jgi:hypothetical protein
VRHSGREGARVGSSPGPRREGSCDKSSGIAVRWCLVKDPSSSWRHSRSWRRPLSRQASHVVVTSSFTFIARVERR